MNKHYFLQWVFTHVSNHIIFNVNLKNSCVLNEFASLIPQQYWQHESLQNKRHNQKFSQSEPLKEFSFPTKEESQKNAAHSNLSLGWFSFYFNSTRKILALKVCRTATEKEKIATLQFPSMNNFRPISFLIPSLLVNSTPLVFLPSHFLF